MVMGHIPRRVTTRSSRLQRNSKETQRVLHTKIPACPNDSGRFRGVASSRHVRGTHGEQHQIRQQSVLLDYLEKGDGTSRGQEEKEH